APSATACGTGRWERTASSRSRACSSWPTTPSRRTCGSPTTTVSCSCRCSVAVGTAVRYRRPVAPQAREHGALPSGADDEAHARQQALVREQLAALEPRRQGALPGASRERRARRNDARPEVRCGFRAPADGAGAAARYVVEVGAPINPGAWPRGWSTRFTLPV